MLVPSKELLSKVLGDVVDYMKDITIEDNEVNITFTKYNKYCFYEYQINIYELAYKCKEWAFKQDKYLSSNLHSSGARCSLVTLTKRIDFDSDTEPEAIFKACEWILEQQVST